MTRPSNPLTRKRHAASGAAAGFGGAAGLTFMATEALGIPAFFVFLVLKVGAGETTVEDWSWWAVTAPLWGGAALSGVLGILALIFLAKSLTD